jgi:hypothetical protein
MTELLAAEMELDDLLTQGDGDGARHVANLREGRKRDDPLTTKHVNYANTLSQNYPARFRVQTLLRVTSPPPWRWRL